MAKVNLSKAAKLVNKNRTTIWRHIKSGRLSSEKDRDGMPMVDTSELLRVYGELYEDATPKTERKQHQATLEHSELLSIIEQLRDEQREMRKQIENLSNRLTYKQEVPLPKEKSIEDHPEWPKEIKTLSDILLRQELKSKYD